MGMTYNYDNIYGGSTATDGLGIQGSDPADYTVDDLREVQGLDPITEDTDTSNPSTNSATGSSSTTSSSGGSGLQGSTTVVGTAASGIVGDLDQQTMVLGAIALAGLAYFGGII